MIDIETEVLLDLKQTAREPAFRSSKTGQPTHVSAVYRWILRGARAANGERVKLETIRTPSGLKTSKEAIARFIAALTDPDAAPTAPTSRARRRQIDAATAELHAAGFEIH